MAFDSNFSENFPFLSAGIFPENPSIKIETPTMLPLLQHNSLLVPPPPNNNTFLYQNNFNHFSLDGSSSSSLNPITNYQDSSIRDLAANGYYPQLGFAPNNTNQLDGMQGLWGSSQKIGPIQLGASSSQPMMDPTLIKRSSLIYDTSARSVPVNPNWLQEELIPSLGVTANGNEDLKIDPKNVALGRRPLRRMFKRTGKKSQKLIGRIKGQWSIDEDKVLIGLVKRFGVKKWSHIAKLLNGRIGKQCRERWYNHLRSDIRKDPWDEEEDKILIESQKELGNKWAEIARRLPGRSENTIKNRWNATKRRMSSKKKNKHNGNSSKETLLESYVKHVIAIEEAEKKLKKSIKKLKIKSEKYNSDQAPTRGPTILVRNENSEGKNFHNEDVWGGQVHGDVGWNLHQHVTGARNGGNVPMMASADEIPNGFFDGGDGTMKYGVPVPMQLDI